MSKCIDPRLQQLIDDFNTARRAEIPDLAEVRRRKDRIDTYFARRVISAMKRHAMRLRREPRFRVIHNSGEVQYNPRRMSSPVKTDEVRNFEMLVGRVFAITATATTEWPGSAAS